METTWRFLINQFLNASVKSYKKTLKLSNYHDAYLNKMMQEQPLDPDWATLYNRYHPFHQAFVEEYAKWKSGGGNRKGQTLNLRQQLKMLITKVNRWGALIQIIPGFEKGKPDYVALFPQGHKPFNFGAITGRVNAVKELSQSLKPYALVNPAIQIVKDEVDTFYTALSMARNTQQGAKGGTKQRSTQVETKRIEAMTEQFRNLGFLINKSAENLSFIAPFFELNVLRDRSQWLYTGTLPAGKTEAVLIHTFVADDELELKITSNDAVPADAQVQLYLASAAGGTDSAAINLSSNKAKITINVADFGISDYGRHRHLTVVNSTTYTFHYEIELL